MALIVARAESSQGGGLPPGVTLEEIDGGPTYYADNGWTYAADSMTIDGVTYADGFDDVDFFPIAMFLENYVGTTEADKWDLLNVNCAMAVQGSVSLSTMNTRGVQLFIQAGEWMVDGGNNLFEAELLANVAGMYSEDEPGTLEEAFGDIENMPNSGTPPGNTGQDGRPWVVTFTHNQITFFDIEGVDMDVVMSTDVETPNTSLRQLDIPVVDVYFFAGARGGATNAWLTSRIPAMYGLGRTMKEDEAARCGRYADLTRWIRLGRGANPPFKADTPMFVWIETGTPYNETTTEGSAIRSAEINSAVWASLIAGARFVGYFTLGDASSWNAGGMIGTSFWDTPYNGDSVSNQDQMQATNDFVRTMAPVLNSPFAVDYATVSPSAVVMTSSVPDSGFDFMVKYRNREDDAGADSKFYIFAYPRYGNRTHDASGNDTGAESWPKTATFTIADTDATQVTVINESRTISVTAGEFEDEFATKDTVHIYRVD